MLAAELPGVMVAASVTASLTNPVPYRFPPVKFSVGAPLPVRVPSTVVVPPVWVYTELVPIENVLPVDIVTAPALLNVLPVVLRFASPDSVNLPAAVFVVNPASAFAAL